MTHKEKTKLALIMLSPTERKNRVPKFLSQQWLKRKYAIELRLKR